MNAAAGSRDEIRSRELPLSGRLRSLWDMLKLEIGRLLEAHEIITVEKGNFERAARHIDINRGISLPLEWKHIINLLDVIGDVERITRDAGLISTSIAASRTKQCLEVSCKQLSEKIGDPPDCQDVAILSGEAYRTLWTHLEPVMD